MVKPVIMVVEDNQTTQETLKRDLEALGLDVLIAPTAKEAWTLLENGNRPNLIILDFNLPGEEDGPAFFRRIRMDAKYKTISVIPFTALLEDQAGRSKVSSFFSASRPVSPHVHVIISKKGREDVYKTPEELIIEIGRALNNQNIEIPDIFRKERRKYLEKHLQNLEGLNRKYD
jgi:CheY-like chemotaxis protein